ncbi:hypothetical protein EYF80_032285 [Liparis tanakae]|uniref:Uncharacterized protein n=1 Tax=Liparis tanakae TaxID=230148 RepID=A0A4Z2GVT1_9TELE|nr:hypothetical protein EYF80_032285 [Liparis tanakae]
MRSSSTSRVWTPCGTWDTLWRTVNGSPPASVNSGYGNRQVRVLEATRILNVGVSTAVTGSDQRVMNTAPGTRSVWRHDVLVEILKETLKFSGFMNPLKHDKLIVE